MTRKTRIPRPYSPSVPSVYSVSNKAFKYYTDSQKQLFWHGRAVFCRAFRVFRVIIRYYLAAS
jgi:hypothetical protein